MKTLLFATFLKPGTLGAYERFVAKITGPRKKEYSELLKRYGLKTAKVWYEKLSDRDYIMIVHDDALERLKNWTSSTHPFDLWFSEQLNMYYEKFPEPSHLLSKFDAYD